MSPLLAERLHFRSVSTAMNWTSLGDARSSVINFATRAVLVVHSVAVMARPASFAAVADHPLRSMQSLGGVGSDPLRLVGP